MSAINLLETYETANWSLRQGDEEVNKRIRQKYIYLNKLANISVWKQTFFRGQKKNENKTKSSLQIGIWKCDNKDNRLLLVHRRPVGIIYHWASSRLFISRGDIVFPLCIKWARAFLTASRLPRMSSSGIRMTSLIECPARLKFKETGVGSLTCWWSRWIGGVLQIVHLVGVWYWHVHLLH